MIAPSEKLDLGFKISVVRDGVAAEVSFGELLTRRTVVSVYMTNNTPSCDRQNDALIAVATELDHAGFNLVALSRDTCRSHVRYAAAKGIGYTLASDPEDRFARAAFVFDRDGTVLAVAEKVDTAGHDAQLKELIKPLRAETKG